MDDDATTGFPVVGQAAAVQFSPGARLAFPELSIPHRPNHPLAGVPWRGDNPTLGTTPVLRTDDRHRPGLALLIQYAAQLWEHVVPSVPIGRALGELAVAEFCSPEHAARHDDPRLPVELRRLLRWIDGHLADQITVAKLADIAGCSPTSVNRLFRRHLCAAPMDWVIARRVDRARELLSRTHLTVAEVAHQSGLTDPYYFSRLFKIRTGMPPREWRRQFSAP